MLPVAPDGIPLLSRGTLPKRLPASLVLWILAITLVLAIFIASGLGAYSLSFSQILTIAGGWLGLGDQQLVSGRDTSVFLAIRLPRVLAAALVGAGLGAAGSALQGLFRTPLAEPGLVGVSSGSALAAAALLPLTVGLSSAVGEVGARVLVLVLASGCGIGLTAIVLVISHRRGVPSVLTMLLIGIAVNSFSAAGIAVVIFADPTSPQLETTFWLLGSLGGSGWLDVAMLAPAIIGSMLILNWTAPSIDASVLGDVAAHSIGIDIKVQRWIVVGAVALATAAATSVAGIVGFVGLVAPTLLRPIIGARHRPLIIGGGCAGALLTVIADTLARTVIAPAELPIGVITTGFGAPVFLAVLLRERRAGRM